MPNPFKMKRPANAKAPFQFIKMEDNSQPARVNIYDIIGETWWDEGITGKNFVAELSAIGGQRPLDVYISSNGGDIKDGTVIYNALLNHQGVVNIIIDGWAISMASVIAMAGDSISMGSIGMMMVHKPLNGCYGNANDMRKNADTLDKMESALTNAYTNKTGLSSEEIATMLDAETWMTADEALVNGFIDSIITGPGTSMSNCFNVDNFLHYKNVPGAVLSVISGDPSLENNSVPPETNELPATPSPDNVQPPNNDSPESDTDIENKRTVEIMHQCKALGLEHMAMELIKNKTSSANASVILLNVKAGIDTNSQIRGQHSSDLQKADNIQSDWDKAFAVFKPTGS